MDCERAGRAVERRAQRAPGAPETERARAYLSQAFLLDEQIGGKLSQVRALREAAERTTAVLGGARAGRAAVSRVEECIVKAADLEREILDDYDALLALKRALGRTIARVQRPELRLLLELRYLSQWDWQRIAAALHYDRRHVHRLHEIALREVGETLEETAGACGPQNPGQRHEILLEALPPDGEEESIYRPGSRWGR